MQMLNRVTDATFDDFIQSHDRAVVDFWAPWCHPCLEVEPRISELSRELRGRVAFAKVNTDENPIITKKFRINSIPAILAFKGGELEDRVIGSASKRELTRFITDAFEP